MWPVQLRISAVINPPTVPSTRKRRTCLPLIETSSDFRHQLNPVQALQAGEVGLRTGLSFQPIEVEKEAEFFARGQGEAPDVTDLRSVGRHPAQQGQPSRGQDGLVKVSAGLG